MKLDKYIDRKYPQSKEHIKKLFDPKNLLLIKEKGYKPARLIRAYSDFESRYEKGTLFIFKRHKDYDEGNWTGEFNIHGIFKCKKGLTESGYHSVSLFYSDFEEVKE